MTRDKLNEQKCFLVVHLAIVLIVSFIAEWNLVWIFNAISVVHLTFEMSVNVNPLISSSVTIDSELTNRIQKVTEIPFSASNYLTSIVLDSNKLINEHGEEKQFVFHFSWLDYGLFVLLLGVSTMIGVYYGFFSKHKQNNTNEYILGGRSMAILPVAISIIATLVQCHPLYSLLASTTSKHSVR